MSDVDGIDHAEDLRRQMREAVAKAAMTPAVRNRKLVLWAVRQVLLCALAWYFWDRVWVRWLFGAGVVLALVHLAMLRYVPRFLVHKAAKAEQRLMDVDRALVVEEEASDPAPPLS